MERQLHVLVCSSQAINIMKVLDGVRPEGKSQSIFKAFSCLSTAKMIELMSRIQFDVVLIEDHMGDLMKWPTIIKNYDNEAAETKILPANKNAAFYLFTVDQTERATLEALNSGYKDCLIKPFDLLLFQQKIKEDVAQFSNVLGRQIYAFPLNEAGEYYNRMDLVEISESHAIFMSGHPVTVGSYIKISSGSINAYGGSTQVSEVKTCEKIDKGYKVKVVFRGVSQEFTRAIRITASREYIQKKSS